MKAGESGAQPGKAPWTGKHPLAGYFLVLFFVFGGFFVFVVGFGRFFLLWGVFWFVFVFVVGFCFGFLSCSGCLSCSDLVLGLPWGIGSQW